MMISGLFRRIEVQTLQNYQAYVYRLSSSVSNQYKIDYENNSSPKKTITEKLSEAMEKCSSKKNSKPKVEKYKPRFEYNGFVKSRRWVYLKDVSLSEHNEISDDYVDKLVVSGQAERGDDTNIKQHIRKSNLKKYCVVVAFSGVNYSGMQWNKDIPTIEGNLFKAMLKNNWVTLVNVQRPCTVEFQRGSRTDRGVSAARMCISLRLPDDVDIDAINKDLPDDIRIIGIKRTIKSFDSRFNCSARTYSYTLPTIAFSHYNDQTSMENYRLSSERLQCVNDVLSVFKGATNFHNYTQKKEHFDRSSIRNIYTIECGQPFIEKGVEFATITIKGQSFMLHQIRKMVGFSLAVIRENKPLEFLKRSLTKEDFSVPTAPGLGLVLEQLHYDQYNRQHGAFSGKLEWDEFEDKVSEFRRKQIYPIIIDTEIENKEMYTWLEYLLNHSYEPSSREDAVERYMEPTFDDTWGEDEATVERLKKFDEVK